MQRRQVFINLLLVNHLHLHQSNHVYVSWPWFPAFLGILHKKRLGRTSSLQRPWGDDFSSLSHRLRAGAVEGYSRWRPSYSSRRSWDSRRSHSIRIQRRAWHGLINYGYRWQVSQPPTPVYRATTTGARMLIPHRLAKDLYSILRSHSYPCYGAVTRLLPSHFKKPSGTISQMSC